MFKLGNAARTAIVGLILCWGLAPSICAAKALFGRVTDIKSADVVTLDHGGGRHDIRIAGIDVPAQQPFARAARQLVANLVLGRNVRLRFISRLPSGEMLGRLDTDDPVLGIKEVAVELVRAGLARVQPGFDGDFAKAESEARNARRGLWAAAR